MNYTTIPLVVAWNENVLTSWSLPETGDAFYLFIHEVRHLLIKATTVSVYFFYVNASYCIYFLPGPEGVGGWLDPLHVVSERRMLSKLLFITDNIAHRLHRAPADQRSVLSQRLRMTKRSAERHRRSFLPSFLCPSRYGEFHNLHKLLLQLPTYFWTTITPH